LFFQYKPGEYFSYKSTDPFVLGLMIGRAVGVSYGDWLQSSVLNSMGAAHVGLFDQDRQGSGLTASGVRMRLDDWMRFALWVQRVSKAQGCLSDYVRAAMTTQIHNPGTPSNRKFGALFDGYGYLMWTDNRIAPGAAFASGWGGQRISWDKRSDRMVIVFSNIESWMPDLYALVRDWNSAGR
jgi:CubicO group peptidase (beta-lactamase class C family)